MKEVIERELQTLIREITTAHVAAGQQVTGKTIESLEIRNTTERSGQLWGASYIGVLDKGRKPGAFPPLYPIRQWVIARGIDRAWGMSSTSAAFIIARRIAEFGTNLFQRGGRTDILQDPFERFEKRLMEAVGAESVRILNQTFEKS